MCSKICDMTILDISSVARIYTEVRSNTEKDNTPITTTKNVTFTSVAHDGFRI